MRESTSNKEESEIYSCCFKKSIGMRSAEMVVADMGLLPGFSFFYRLSKFPMI